MIEFVIKSTNLAVSIKDDDWHRVKEIMGILYGKESFSPELETRTIGLIESLVKDYGTRSGLGISDKERIEILKAMGLTSGHWFKCPNGKFIMLLMKERFKLKNRLT